MHSELTISQADPRPMYLQIIEQVRRRIAVGDWGPGQEIPSIRALAVSTRVSVITVKRAYLELEHAGVIVTRHGKPVVQIVPLDASGQVMKASKNKRGPQTAFGKHMMSLLDLPPGPDLELPVRRSRKPAPIFEE